MLDRIINDMWEYYGVKELTQYNDDQLKIMIEWSKEVDKLPCNKDGATKEQDEAIDRLTEEYAIKIMSDKDIRKELMAVDAVTQCQNKEEEKEAVAYETTCNILKIEKAEDNKNFDLLYKRVQEIQK